MLPLTIRRAGFFTSNSDWTPANSSKTLAQLRIVSANKTKWLASALMYRTIIEATAWRVEGDRRSPQDNLVNTSSRSLRAEQLAESSGIIRRSKASMKPEDTNWLARGRFSCLDSRVTKVVNMQFANAT
jgi:hypothetical protein